MIPVVEDIRWQQRLSNYRRAVQNLERALEQASYNDLELQARGCVDTAGPKPVIRQAFRDGLMSDGGQWMGLLEARNLAAHAGDEDRARDLGARS